MATSKKERKRKKEKKKEEKEQIWHLLALGSREQRDGAHPPLCAETNVIK